MPCRALCHAIYPFGDSGEIGLFKFPYRVLWHELLDVVDLRVPETRLSFFEYFANVAAKDRRRLLSNKSLPDDTITVYSQFHRENYLPPAPRDFWAMLPTLINPDIGGGDPAMQVQRFRRFLIISPEGASCSLDLSIRSGRRIRALPQWSDECFPGGTSSTIAEVGPSLNRLSQRLTTVPGVGGVFHMGPRLVWQM